MADQYFNPQPETEHFIKDISTVLHHIPFDFKTDTGVFSKNRVDFGSRVLLEAFLETHPTLPSSDILELGSGYGPVSIILGKFYSQCNVTGLEINERAYELSRDNLQRNRVENVNFILGDAANYSKDKLYEFVLTNPPIRAGKKVIQKFVTVAFDHLKPQGELWVVIQKKQGAPSMLKFMEEVFGNSQRVSMEKGYWIIQSTKE